MTDASSPQFLRGVSDASSSPARMPSTNLARCGRATRPPALTHCRVGAASPNGLGSRGLTRALTPI